jgi:hypothetical protein
MLLVVLTTLVILLSIGFYHLNDHIYPFLHISYIHIIGQFPSQSDIEHVCSVLAFWVQYSNSLFPHVFFWLPAPTTSLFTSTPPHTPLDLLCTPSLFSQYWVCMYTWHLPFGSQNLCSCSIFLTQLPILTITYILPYTLSLQFTVEPIQDKFYYINGDFYNLPCNKMITNLLILFWLFSTL